MIQPVLIERMKREDLSRVMEIELQCFATPWHESAYVTELSNRSAYYVIATLDDRVVGYAGLWIIMDEAHITTIGVDPGCRGKKIGEQLLLAMLDESVARGGRRITLEVRERNHVAQNLYRKYGFVPAAIRRGYYTDNNENAIVMWINDTRDPQYREKLQRLKQRMEEQLEQSAISSPVTNNPSLGCARVS